MHRPWRGQAGAKQVPDQHFAPEGTSQRAIRLAPEIFIGRFRVAPQVGRQLQALRAKRLFHCGAIPDGQIVESPVVQEPQVVSGHVESATASTFLLHGSTA